jgi:hypothetical protein
MSWPVALSVGSDAGGRRCSGPRWIRRRRYCGYAPYASATSRWIFSSRATRVCCELFSEFIHKILSVDARPRRSCGSCVLGALCAGADPSDAAMRLAD